MIRAMGVEIVLDGFAADERLNNCSLSWLKEIALNEAR